MQENRARHRVGSALVAAQFGLLAVLLWSASSHPQDLAAAAVLLAGLSAALAAWTIAHNRLGNFNIHPQPHVRGQLITSGPYRWVRHPMYSAVLLGAAALATATDLDWAWAQWLALLGVLSAKALLEERWLKQKYPSYAIYCRHSKRFLPWVL